MPGKSSEYAVIHPDQYDRPENAGEWTRRAIEPFVHHLVQNHPDLAQELASMGDPRTDPSTISWIDRGKNIQEFDTYRDYLLGPTDSELTVFGSYQESRELLNPVQQEHSAHTIADAMSHRPAETLNQHLPPNMDYANLHHQGRVPYASSYDSVMEAARNYYTEALTQTQSDIAEGLNLNLPVEYSSALRELRRLEHDIEQTALTGRPPTIHQSHHTASEYYEQMDIRANLLTGSFKAYMEFRFPEHMPGPEGDPYAVVFRQYTSSFPPADVEWMANSIASQRSEELDQKLGDTPGYNPPPFIYHHFQEIKDHLLTRQTDGNPG